MEIKLPKSNQVKFYHVQIFSDEDSEKLIFDTKSKAEIIKWNSAKAGSFYLKYSIIDYWDQEGPFSDLSKLKIVMEADANLNITEAPPPSLSFPIQQHQQQQQNSGNMGFSPTMYNFSESNSTHTASYDGIAVQAVKLKFSTQSRKINPSLDLYYARGKVFTTLDFNHLNAKLTLDYNFEKYSWIRPELGMQYESLNFYRYESAALQNESKSFIGILAGTKFSYAKFASNIQYCLGELSGPSVSLQYQFSKWIPEIYYFKRSYSDSTRDIDYSGIGANLSYNFSWN